MFLLYITLFVVRIERVSIGLSSGIPRSSRLISIGLGAVAIALGIVEIMFPLFATRILVDLGILVFYLLELQGSFIAFASPLLGIFLLTFILTVNILIIRIESISYGITNQ
jgi:hypothetical protein